MSEQNQNSFKNKKVTYGMFILIISMIVVMFGVVFDDSRRLNNRVDRTNETVVDMRVDVGVTKTNVIWIMEAIRNGDIQVKK